MRKDAIFGLFDPKTGVSLAIIDVSGITDIRTGAVTALGARLLAHQVSKVLGQFDLRH